MTPIGILNGPPSDRKCDKNKYYIDKVDQLQQ